MSKELNVEYLERGKRGLKDYRIFPGTELIIDCSDLVGELVGILGDTQYYDISYPDGLYLNGSNDPVILPGVDYYYRKGKKVVTIPAGSRLSDISGDILDIEGKVVVGRNQIRGLRPWPADNVKIANMLVAYTEDLINSNLRGRVGCDYTGDYVSKTLEELILPYLANETVVEYWKADRSGEYDWCYPDELEVTMYKVADCIDRHLVEVVSKSVLANNQYEWDVSFRYGVLTVTALNDWRVIEWEQHMRDREAEDKKPGSAWDTEKEAV